MVLWTSIQTSRDRRKYDFHYEDADGILHWNFNNNKKKPSGLSGLQVTFKTIRNKVTVNKERAGLKLLTATQFRRKQHTRKGKSEFHVFHSITADMSRKVKSAFGNFPRADVNPNNPRLPTSEKTMATMKNVNSIILRTYFPIFQRAAKYCMYFSLVINFSNAPACFRLRLASAFSSPPRLPADWVLI